MAQSPSSTVPPVTEDAFLADRMKFWREFTGFTLFVVISIVILLILMAIFLV